MATLAAEPQLLTARLLLRPLQLPDFEGWASLMADEAAARPIGGPLSRSLAWRGFMSVAGSWHLTGFGMFSVLERRSGRWIGRVGPWYPEGWPGTEIGWALLPDCWGQGYATEAAIAAADWAFATLGWDEIVHLIRPDNSLSRRVALKLGSRNRGPVRMPPPYESDVVEQWGQSRGEWFAQRPQLPLR